MSFDLLIFKSEDTPRDKQKFIVWYEALINWKEDYDYTNHETIDESIKSFFLEMVETFPPMNGPLSQEDVADDMESYLTDYSIGDNFIYCSFSWSNSEEADALALKLAKKYHVGYFGLSGYSDIIYNSKSRSQRFSLLEDGYMVTDEADEQDVLASLNELEETDFIIIDPLISIEGNVFIQTMREKNHDYTVETRFEIGDDFKQYQKVMTLSEVIRVFRNYINGITPDISEWKDITIMLKEEQPKLLN